MLLVIDTNIIVSAMVYEGKNLEYRTTGMIDSLDYILYQKANGVFSQKLDKAVESAKKHEEWGNEYMTLNRMLAREHEDGLIFGSIKEAIKHGIQKAVLISDLMSDYDLSEEEAKEKIQEFESEDN